MSAINKYVGWGISTWLLSLLNKGSNSAEEAGKPENLNVSANQTKIGSPIPVVLGRCLVKSPIVSYFGDFSFRAYTETYAAHANFSAWPLVLSLIAQYIAMLWTGHSVGEGRQISGGVVKGGEGGRVDDVQSKTKGRTKDDRIGPLLNSLFLWLLNWLINGRNLKTTVQKGFKYYLGYQFLIAWSGDEMRLRAIYMGQKKVWEGDLKRSELKGAVHTLAIDKPELFGGVDEGGGFIGDFAVYLGGEEQTPHPWMAKEMRRESVQKELRGLTPGYAPYVSAVVPTAYIGKRATIPETWIELQNCPNALGLGQIGEDANPAEILYALITNTDWGVAEHPDVVDRESLVKMGETLKKEGIGLSVQLTSKSKAQALIDKICEHINAVRFSHPATGKLTFRLIRDDYKIEECLRLNPSNCSKADISRLDWSETISEVSVSFIDRANQYEAGTIPARDPANIEIHHGVQTVKTYDYNFFTTPGNAKWAAERELHSQGYPLATVSIEGNRELSGVRIGDVVVLDWPPYGIRHMLLRVTSVDLGSFLEGRVQLETIEDVFGLAKTDFSFSDSTEWKPEDKYPAGVQIMKYLEMPYEIVNDRDTYVTAFAARPDKKTDLWTVWRQETGKPFVSTSSMSKWTPTGRLAYDIEEFSDVEDILGFEIVNLGGVEELESGTVDIAAARKGNRLLIVDDEIMAYSTLIELANGHWYVKGVLRGVFDTVPKKHTAQAHVFFIRSGNYAQVTTGGPVCAAGEAVTEEYNITTATVKHKEDFDHTKVQSLTTKRRSLLPVVPGRFRIGAHMAEEKVKGKDFAGDIRLSFAPRNNRQSFGAVSQDDVLEYWTKQPLEAAEGTDYFVRLTVGDEVREYAFPQSPITLGWEQHCLDFRNLSDMVRLELFARRDGLLSYQAHERTFQWTIPVLVDVVASEDEARERLQAWGIVDRIVMPDGAMATSKQVMYKDLPLFALGEEAPPTEDGAIFGHDGKSYRLTGEILCVSGKAELTAYTMKKGYTFNSYYVPAAAGGEVQSYAWDGETIQERRGMP